MDDETLARFIFSSRHIRHDRTVRPEAFMPRHGEGLSVVRHDDLREPGLWAVGKAMEQDRVDTLHGRSDVAAATFVAHHLRVAAAPTAVTIHHAEVIGWPDDKSARLLVAKKIAAKAGVALEAPTSSGNTT
jgi:hypothetical protein